MHWTTRLRPLFLEYLQFAGSMAPIIVRSSDTEYLKISSANEDCYFWQKKGNVSFCSLLLCNPSSRTALESRAGLAVRQLTLTWIWFLSLRHECHQIEKTAVMTNPQIEFLSGSSSAFRGPSTNHEANTHPRHALDTEHTTPTSPINPMSWCMGTAGRNRRRLKMRRVACIDAPN